MKRSYANFSFSNAVYEWRIKGKKNIVVCLRFCGAENVCNEHSVFAGKKSISFVARALFDSWFFKKKLSRSASKEQPQVRKQNVPKERFVQG